VHYSFSVIEELTVKQKVVHSKPELEELLRKFLEDSTLPAFSVTPNNSSELYDLLVTAYLDDQEQSFAVDCQLKASARDIEFLQAVEWPAPPLLATVKLTESLVGQCKRLHVNCLDLNGRIWIHAPGLLIDRHPSTASVRYRLAEPELKFFSPKSTRLASALLSFPGRTWRQADLSELTGLSQGLLSRLLNFADRQGWVQGKGQRGNWKISDPTALLDAWQEADDWQGRVTLRQYSTLETDLTSLARQLAAATTGDLAFTQWFAANLRFPYTQPPVLSAYRREFLGEEEQESLGLRQVVDGGRLWILVPRDPGVFQTVRRVEGLPIVCDAQIYLDLRQVGLRGPDQAEALRNWRGFCRP